MAIADRREAAVLQPSKPTSLLAVLLTRPNVIVPVESLQRAIWGEDIPATAKASLHSCVLRLRRLFAKYGISGSTIEALPGGYRMAADARTLDLLEFRELLVRADHAADQEEELSLLRAGLELWQLPVLGNVHSDVLHREEVPRLAEEWLRTAERVYDIELALGRCREVLSELWPLARSHPAHERFWEQLIEALHRTGRRADALAEYRRVRDHLREELGVEPGTALRNLELAVLRGELPTVQAVRPPARTAKTAARRTTNPGANPATNSGANPGANPAPTDGAPLDAAPLDAAALDTTSAAGALAGCAQGDVVLAGLVGAGLLRECPDGHYHVHELLRAFILAAEGSWARAPEEPNPARPDAGADPTPSVRQSAASLLTSEV
ncbi:AfsR/SARP family transcriptional regulator [Kitasatospora sp. NA04385]|nr:AfsR/SARP family transcriptional regulator [Kitasatospora sp. NA04385]